MAKALQRADEIAEESIEIWDLVSSETKTPKQIASERNISLKTVYNRINQGREIVADEIRNRGQKYLADIWKKYELIYTQAKEQWEQTRNVLFLKEMRAVLEAQRKMLSIDMPPKAAVNEDGKSVPDQLIFVISDEQYRKAEEEMKELENKTLEGDYVNLGDSTDGLLPDDEESVE